ncbi:deoxynucleoside triphosphate triphosphohydrolase SAMHD1-like [Sphaeramia orbicularis]|uniref:deoxynucleoside triphosphate triphosphohydrolase SAMHD1-like n=1 Tax=Sphaeramia orbicularis TaxID=375764 RepID=UPI001180B8C9|nr:deoxynucleoside triphosphate triphosphohydrolase SAMHD1-like [Sphaeramia orbicularis]
MATEEPKKKTARVQTKVFNDPVHGHVELHPLLCKIIDTPQFQRLRNIKQLGGAYYVYPGASHNRFEHSIGVAHLAGQFARTLKERQLELGIDDKDILCVEVAGLCHDLGHGPFSHLFDGNFIPKVRPGHKWKHEEASIAMFDHLMRENGLENELDEDDRVFIKEMIFGPLEPETSERKEWPYKGRTKDKSFLYEIVSNKRNGIDVDKFDYFARDCLHLGMKNSFDHCRFIKFARVCKVAEDGQPDGEWQICIRDKEVSNIYEMFHTRSRLHRRAYQHKTNKIIELMITEAFEKADKHIRRKGSDRELILSETIDDMEAYTKLTDHIFDEILNSSSADLKEAREILQKVVTRKFYPYLGQIKRQQNQNITEMELKEQLAEEFGVTMKPNDFEIIVSKIDFGMKHKNPIDYLRFYKKDDSNKAFRFSDDQVSDFVLPRVFSEQWIRFYCRKSLTNDDLKAARETFENWRQTVLHPEPNADGP